MAYTGNTDLAILLNKDKFEQDPTVLTFKADSTSKGTWGMVLLIVRGLLRRPSLIHNVVAKKRDASTTPSWIYAGAQRRLHWWRLQHECLLDGR